MSPLHPLEDVRRRAAEKLVEQLAGERVKLNARHFKYWRAA